MYTIKDLDGNSIGEVLSAEYKIEQDQEESELYSEPMQIKAEVLVDFLDINFIGTYEFSDGKSNIPVVIIRCEKFEHVRGFEAFSASSVTLQQAGAIRDA